MALDEHMRHQPPRASRPYGFISKDFERELTFVFVESLSLKRTMLTSGANILYDWHHPGAQYDFDMMSIGASHAAPHASVEHTCKVALCFLPSIRVDGDRHLLGRAQVKVAEDL